MNFSFDKSSPYMSQHNPDIYPLCAFHCSKGHTFDPLPSEGRIREICTRIQALCIAPFLYLLLSFRASFGLLMEPLYYRRHLCIKRTELLISMLETSKPSSSTPMPQRDFGT